MNKAGEEYSGEKPDDMSEEEFEKMMAKKGYHKKMKKSEEEESEEEESEEGEDMEEEVEKSEAAAEEVSTETLDEVLGQLETLAKSTNPASEKEELLSKAQAGTITAEENEKLVSLLSGTAPGLADEVLKGLESDAIVKSIEVSDYLEAHNEGVKFGLSYLAEQMEKSQAVTGEFNHVLAKSLVAFVQEIGAKIEALSASLDSWGEKEAVAVKKPITAKPIEKSLGAEEPQMHWRDAIAVLGAMFEDSIEKSMHGRTENGTQLNEAIAYVNRTHTVPAQLSNEIKQFQAKRGLAS
jgi:hypothetical protein